MKRLSDFSLSGSSSKVKVIGQVHGHSRKCDLGNCWDGRPWL